MQNSVTDNFEMDHEKQFEVLDRHIRLTDHMFIEPVDRDGLCIFNSVKKNLEAKNIFKTISELKDILRDEVSSNIEHYKSFSVPSINIMLELEQFLEQPSKGYILDSVDFVLHALSKGLKIKSKIYTINEYGYINASFIGQEDKEEIDAIFAKTNIRHIDPVLCIPYHEVKLEETRMEQYDCPICRKSLPGPLRLKRHIAVCVPPTYQEEDSKAFIPLKNDFGPITITDSDDNNDESEYSSCNQSSSEFLPNRQTKLPNTPGISFHVSEILSEKQVPPSIKPETFSGSPSFLPRASSCSSNFVLSDDDDNDHNSQNESPITSNSDIDSTMDSDFISSDEETLVTEKITSPYESNEFTSFQSYNIIDNDIQKVINLLCSKDIAEYVVKERVPWHVSKSAAFVIDPTTFTNKSDISIDCWTWELNNTYKCSVLPDKQGKIPRIVVPKKGNNIDSFRIIKRNYVCRENEHFKKRITSILKPGVVIDKVKRPFTDVEHLMFLQYTYPSDEANPIPPSAKPRTYESVKTKLKKNLQAEKSVKKSTYQTEKEVGGFENVSNSSFLPSRNQARYIQHKEKTKDSYDDPLRELMEKQHSDSFKFIRSIETDAHSFSVFLIGDNQLHNIANYCTTDNPKWKSELSWDFTFKLGKFDVLVMSYRNTSLISKRTKNAPSMLGAILICHQRNHEVVKVACDQLISLLPGLKEYIKVNVCDGEKAITNNVCEAFQNSLLLLCNRHGESNVREHLPLLTRVQKNEILSDIFGAKGLVDSETFEEFNVRKAAAYEKWKKDYCSGVINKFIQYFEKNKSEEFKFHLMKGSVNAAQLNGSPDKVYNNNLESLNNVIKLWQGQQEVDLFKFVNDMEELVKCQDAEVFRAFTKNNGPAGSSTYYVNPEFQSHMVDFNLEYANRAIDEKKEIMIVDAKTYKEVINFNVGENARATARSNMSILLNSKEITADAPESTNKRIELLSSMVPHIHIDTIRDIVNKSKHNISKEIIKNTEWWVKSPDGPHPYVVKRNSMNGHIACGSECKGFKMRSLCSHTVGVGFALDETDLKKYLCQLKKLKSSVTKSVSSQITNTAGRKKQTINKRKNKRSLDTPECKKSTPMRTFFIKPLTGNISTCFGCAKCLNKSKYVVAYRDDHFTYGNSLVKKLQNVHFHLDSKCILMKYPDFDSELTVSCKLSDSDLKELKKEFKLNFKF